MAAAWRPRPRQQPRVVAQAGLQMGDLGTERAQLTADARQRGPAVEVTDASLHVHEALIGAEPIVEIATHRPRLAAERVVVVAAEQDRLPAVGAQTLGQGGLGTDAV